MLSTIVSLESKSTLLLYHFITFILSLHSMMFPFTVSDKSTGRLLRGIIWRSSVLLLLSFSLFGVSHAYKFFKHSSPFCMSQECDSGIYIYLYIVCIYMILQSMMFYNVPQRFCVHSMRFRTNYISLWYSLTQWHRLIFYSTYRYRLGSLAKVRLEPFNQCCFCRAQFSIG